MAKASRSRLWTLEDDPEHAVIGADGRLYVHARPEKCAPSIDVMKELKLCFTEKMLDNVAATVAVTDVLSGSESECESGVSEDENTDSDEGSVEECDDDDHDDPV
tara:strand:+ start:223 stop:537 length:315 start_codon:yes stop_codon:yes gene_type:complete